MKLIIVMTGLSRQVDEFLSDLEYDDSLSSDEELISRDELFYLLKAPRRRDIVRYMSNFDEPYELEEATMLITSIEEKKKPHQITSDEKKRTYVGLYQVHLPTLDEHEVIEYDSNLQRFEKGPKFELVDSYVAENFYPVSPIDRDGKTSSWRKIFNSILGQKD